MCHKMNLIGIILCALGIGFLLSCILSGIWLRLLVGFVLTVIGFLIIHHR